MIIVWRGWGIIVIPIFAAAFIASVAIVGAMGPQPVLVKSLVGAIVSVIGAFGLWLIANRIETSDPERVFIDKATGREVRIRRSAGSLFFIPTKYWAFIGGALGIFLAIEAPYMDLKPNAHASIQSPASTTQSPSSTTQP